MKSSKKKHLLFSIAGLLSLGFAANYGWDYTQNNLKTDLLEAAPAQVNSENSTAQRALDLGEAAMTQGQFLEAASHYAAATELDPENPFLFLKLSKAYHAAGDDEKALRNAEHAYELKADPTTTAEYAYALVQMEKWNDAKQAIETLKEPSQLSFYTQGLIDLAQENTAGALASFKSAKENGGLIAPEVIEEFIQTLENFDQVQGSDTNYQKALLAKVAIDAKEWKLAKNLALTALNNNSRYRDVWVLLGYAQMQLKTYAEAIDSFKEAKKIDGIKPEVHYFLGSAELLNKNFEAAAKSMELALLYGFTPPNLVYEKLAEAYEGAGQWKEALASNEALINLELGEGTASVDLFVKPVSLALENLKDADRAQSLAEQATEAFKDAGLGYTLLAQSYLVRAEQDPSNLEKAGESIQKALSYSDHLGEAYFTQGEWAEKKSDPSKAQEAFKNAYEHSEDGTALKQEAALRYNALLQTPSKP